MNEREQEDRWGISVAERAESMHRMGRKAGMTKEAIDSLVDQGEKTYEVVKFVNPRDAVAALEGLAVHAVAGPRDPDAYGILWGHLERDGCMVSFHDVMTNKEIVRTDIRNFVEIYVP